MGEKAHGYTIKSYASQLSEVYSQNHLAKCLDYVSEKVTQVSGVIDALERREEVLKKLEFNACLRRNKQQSLAVCKDNPQQKSQLEHDLQTIGQQLEADILSVREINQRIHKEVDQSQNERATQMKKIMVYYAQGNLELGQVLRELHSKCLI
jgi:hypothetical protein